LRRIRRNAFLLAMLVLMPACDGDVEDFAVSATSSPAADDADGFSPGPLPASAMWAEYTDLVGIFESKAEELVAGCMAREGFEYRPLPLQPWQGWDEVVAARPIRELSVEQASERGYLSASDPTEAVPHDLFDGPENERAAFNEALTGSETMALDNGMILNVDGCLGESRASVAGEVEKMAEWLGMSGTLQSVVWAAFNEVEASDEWQSALGRWQQCLAEEGYAVGSQEDLVTMALVGAEDLSGRPVHEQDDEPIEGEARPTELEKELATLDAACQQVTGVVAEWDQLVSLAEQRLVADSPEVVITWAETSAGIRAAVADVLATVPDPGVDPATQYSVPPPQPSSGGG
jgi:hypothetical protein